jgi:hypothetical protein
MTAVDSSDTATDAIGNSEKCYAARRSPLRGKAGLASQGNYGPDREVDDSLGGPTAGAASPVTAPIPVPRHGPIPRPQSRRQSPVPRHGAISRDRWRRGVANGTARALLPSLPLTRTGKRSPHFPCPKADGDVESPHSLSESLIPFHTFPASERG